jgi:hypothetical protein
MASKHSLLIRIEEPIQEFQQDLHAKGRALRQLPKCPFPDADAVMAVVDSIKSALTFKGEICEEWVTAHVKQNGAKKYLANIYVHKVRSLHRFFDDFYCTLA